MFFSKNEDLFFSGKMANLGLREEMEEIVGRDQVLFKDILILMETGRTTPIKKRRAVEWLKRHAHEDITAWATAYYYMADCRLPYREVAEIVAGIPEEERQNPFYRLLLDYHKRLGRIQPGRSMTCDSLRIFRILSPGGIHF